MRRVGLLEPEKMPEVNPDTDILGFRKKTDPEKTEETKKRKPRGTTDEVSDI